MVNLIFDLDGCLIDSTEVQKAAFYGSYHEVVGDDKCPSFEEYLKYTGDSIVNVMRKMGLPIEMVAPYRRISSEAIDKITVNSECIELIEKYRKHGSKIAICTGKDHYRAEDILRYYRIDHLFDVLISSDDVSEPKPSAVPVLTAISRMQVNRSSCIFIGDGYNDILSAHNADVKAILTLWYGDVGTPREADYTVSKVKQLYSVLNEIENGMR